MQRTIETAFAIAMAALALTPAAYPAQWPAAQNGLAFSFQTATEEIYAIDPDGNRMYGFFLTPTGRARTDHAGRLLAAGGAFSGEGLRPGLEAAFNGSTELSFVAVLTSHAHTAARQQILAFAPTVDAPAVALIQEGARLLLSTAAGDRPLGSLKPGRPVHVVLVLSPDRITCYLDGAKSADIERPAASDRGEIPTPLTVGSGSFDTVGWRGAVEGIAMYARALNPGECAADHEAYARVLSQRASPAVLRVKAKLIGKSEAISVEDLAPYSQSLTVYAYEVVESPAGETPVNPLYVAHWTILDGTALPFIQIPIGKVVDLELEPFEANRQIESENLSDLIVDDFSLPLFYDAGGVSLGLE